jgi:hypothetical protein
LDNINRDILKVKLNSFKGTAFQDAMDRVFSCIYGDNFQRIKQKRDAGSDGILFGQTILAGYSPENYSLRDYKKKILGDFKSYQKNWATSHQGWQVVTNLELTSQMLQYTKELKADAEIVCIEKLLALILSQTWTVKLSIFRALDIPDNYINNDVVATIIEDLIQMTDEGSDFSPYTKPLYIKDKIDLNLSPENREIFLDEYEEYLSSFPAIAHVVKNRSQTSILALRSKIRTTYISLSGTFETKLNNLTIGLAQNKSQDDFYVHFLRIVLIYFFEQCLFGAKSTSELEVEND